VGEVDREDGVGLHGEELSPGRSGPSWRRSEDGPDFLRGGLWGSRSRPEVLTCGDRHYPTARHDHGRVASSAGPAAT
jgi:hypothetical protein